MKNKILAIILICVLADYSIIFKDVATGSAAYSLSFKHTLPANGGF